MLLHQVKWPTLVVLTANVETSLLQWLAEEWLRKTKSDPNWIVLLACALIGPDSFQLKKS
jgi:hypothetical protein